MLNLLEFIKNVLPVIIVIESFLASIPLLLSKNYGSALYWFSAGSINFTVIFLVKKYG